MDLWYAGSLAGRGVHNDASNETLNLVSLCKSVAKAHPLFSQDISTLYLKSEIKQPIMHMHLSFGEPCSGCCKSILEPPSLGSLLLGGMCLWG
jgi:hypothetical protein